MWHMLCLKTIQSRRSAVKLSKLREVDCSHMNSQSTWDHKISSDWGSSWHRIEKLSTKSIWPRAWNLWGSDSSHSWCKQNHRHRSWAVYAGLDAVKQSICHTWLKQKVQHDFWHTYNDEGKHVKQVKFLHLGRCPQLPASSTSNFHGLLSDLERWGGL